MLLIGWGGSCFPQKNPQQTQQLGLVRQTTMKNTTFRYILKNGLFNNLPEL